MSILWDTHKFTDMPRKSMSSEWATTEELKK